MSGVHVQFAVDYPEFRVAVDFAAPGRGVTALFGPSGSGKTTCLRVIAGLEKSADTRIEVNGAVWQDDAPGVRLAPHERAVGYVFQEASLFDHLDVRRNVAYGLRRVPAEDRRVTLDHVVELLGIGPLLARRPSTLSGGERQRVAIARALAVSPALLLMDEPLAAVDAQRKDEILPYLERLHRELDIPVLYVSHQMDEVSRLADHLVLLEGGRAVASGGAVDLMTRPGSPLAAGDGASTLILAQVIRQDPEDFLTMVAFPGGRLTLPYRAAAIGETLRLRIQARDVSIALERPTATSILNILPATVAAMMEEAPGEVMVTLDLEGTRLLSRVTRKSVSLLDLTPGQPVFAQIKGVALLK